MLRAGIVLENLATNFSAEVQIPEVILGDASPQVMGEIYGYDFLNQVDARYTYEYLWYKSGDIYIYSEI